MKVYLGSSVHSDNGSIDETCISSTYCSILFDTCRKNNVKIAQLNVNIAVNIKFNNYDNRIVSPFLNNSVYHTHADINSIFLVQGTCLFQLAFQYCMCDTKKYVAKIRQRYYDSTKCQCNNETYNFRYL